MTKGAQALLVLAGLLSLAWASWAYCLPADAETIQKNDKPSPVTLLMGSDATFAEAVEQARLYGRKWRATATKDTSVSNRSGVRHRDKTLILGGPEVIPM